MIDAQSHEFRYERPSWVARQIVTPILTYAAKHFGLSITGVCVLAVRGRNTGLARETIVYTLNMYGDRFLVAPRGQTEWVRNLRHAGIGLLRLGAREELVHAYEVDDDAKPPILREYLRRWRTTTGRYFAVDGPDASPEAFRRIAPAHPVFRLSHR